MLNAIRTMGGRFVSWVTGQGAREMAKKAAVAQTTKDVYKGYQQFGDEVNKNIPDPNWKATDQGLKMLERGQKKTGFFGSVAISILIGVGVSIVLPGAGLIATGIIQGLGTTAVETGIGALTDDETPTPAPVQTEEPVEENLPPVSGTDPEPGDPGYQPQPAPTPFIYTNVTAAPHEPEPCDPDDPHGGCYEPPHEEDPEH